MVRVRAGRFQMGSPESEPGRSSDEGPRVEVVLTRDYFMSRHELTQKQWVQAMGNTPWRTYRDVIERIGNPDELAFPARWRTLSRGEHGLVGRPGSASFTECTRGVGGLPTSNRGRMGVCGSGRVGIRPGVPARGI